MNELFVDLILHVLCTYLAGYIVFRKWGNRSIAFWGAFTGGILIDLDHFIDYFMTYGPQFILGDFLQGNQFLSSNKLFIFFHAWEYIALLTFIIWILKEKKVMLNVFLIALTLSMTLHLVVDTVVTTSPLKLYSILYRASVNFDLEKISGKSPQSPSTR